MKRAQSVMAVVVMGVASACNLSDLSRINFFVPAKIVTLDTMTQNLGLPQTLPSIACVTDVDCCGGGSCPSAPILVRCDGGACSATAPFTLVDTIDLSDVPNLAQVSSLAQVTLRSVLYAVCQNTLTLPIPSLELWLAPQNISTADPAQGAKKIGTAPAVPARTNRNCPPSLAQPEPSMFAQVMLEPDASSTFAAFAQNVRAPFHVLAVGTVTLRSGDPTPMGAVTLLVSGNADASLR